MTTVIFSLGQHAWLQQIPENWQKGQYQSRLLPDRERLLKVITPIRNTHCIIFCNLIDAEFQVWPLLQLASTLRDNGALSIGLVTPYLPYMRQGATVTEGEACNAKYFARLLNDAMDWMVTVNPHLTRANQLNEIYNIPTIVVSAADCVGEWIKRSVARPMIVAANQASVVLSIAVAEYAGCPWATLIGQEAAVARSRAIELNPTLHLNYQPIVMGEIVSTGESMLRAAHVICSNGVDSVIGIAVHVLLRAADEQRLRADPCIHSLVSVDTINHSSNQINIGAKVWDCVSEITDNTLEFV